TGFRARGDRFVVHLQKPDSTFMSKLTMPFFQATSRKLPLDREVSTASAPNQIPTAGPYMLAYNDPNTTTQIRRNPYYRGPRPRFLKGVTLYWNQQLEQAYQDTIRNRFDEGPVPPQDEQDAVNRFGVNRTRV